MQKAKLRDAVCLPSDIALPAAEMAMVGRCIPPLPPVLWDATGIDRT